MLACCISHYCSEHDSKYAYFFIYGWNIPSGIPKFSPNIGKYETDFIYGWNIPSGIPKFSPNIGKYETENSFELKIFFYRNITEIKIPGTFRVYNVKNNIF